MIIIFSISENIKVHVNSNFCELYQSETRGLEETVRRCLATPRGEATEVKDGEFVGGGTEGSPRPLTAELGWLR